MRSGADLVVRWSADLKSSDYVESGVGSSRPGYCVRLLGVFVGARGLGVAGLPRGPRCFDVRILDCVGRLTSPFVGRRAGRWWLGLLKIIYLLMRWFFGLTVLVFRGDQARDAELLVLRHGDLVLRRLTDRVRHGPGDRAWFATLAPFISRRSLYPDASDLLAWYRKLAARRYDTPTSPCMTLQTREAVTLCAPLGAGIGNRLVVAVQVKRQRRVDLEDRAGFSGSCTPLRWFWSGCM